jgi:16S rRNA (cytosine1402-N4)-methyltransferase
MGPDAARLDDVLKGASVDELRGWLADYGDVRGARRCARAIKEALDEDRLETTTALADVARGSTSARPGTDPAILVFQALRIAVNRELEHLESAVEQLPDVVTAGGRGVFISFHSHEDRVVKHGLRELARDCVCPPDLPVCGCDAVAKVDVLTSSPIEPKDEEVEENPRARSARLRAAEVLEFG